MAFTNWTTNNTTIQGDLNLNLEKGRVYADFVELYLFAYSAKWQSFNIALEYRFDQNDSWKEDTKILSADVDYIKGNLLYGLQASSSGTLNKIVWKFTDNYVRSGDVPELRVRILPTLRQFSDASGLNLITTAYGENKVDLVNQTSNYQILGIDNYGRYIATDSTRIRILNAFEGEPHSIALTYDGVLNPLHALQTYDDRYIIADTGNNRIIELDEVLNSIVKTYNVFDPQFVDYAEENSMLLITSRNPDTIYEVNWTQNDPVVIYWSSTISLSDPSCATYSRNNTDEIIISDTGNNRIIVYNRLSNAYEVRNTCTFRSDDTTEDSTINLYRPFRSYKLYDNQICIVEERGLEINWQTIESSSSSSSSSIDSSSSSSNSSSSSSSWQHSSSSSSSSSSIDSSSSSSLGESSSSSSLDSSSSSSSSLGESSSSSSSLDSSSSSSLDSSSSSSVL
jgi:hypothetical protein